MNKLSKSNNKELSTTSEKLINKWKSLVKKKKEKNNLDQSMISQSTTISTSKQIKKNEEKNNEKIPSELIDKDHSNLRNAMKKILYEAFIKNLPNEYTKNDAIEKVLSIEKEMNDNLKEGDYLTKGRAIASHLSVLENEEFKINILNGNLTPENLIKMENNEMISSKEKNNIKKIKETLFESKRSDWNKQHQNVKEGMYTCFKCKGKRVTTQEIQMRSADEPMTVFVTCVECGNNWRIG